MLIDENEADDLLFARQRIAALEAERAEMLLALGLTEEEWSARVRVSRALVPVETVEGVVDSPDALAVGEVALTDEQLEAVERIVEWWRAGREKVFTLTGAAGTGKTTILRALRSRLGECVAWSAMTGKAAVRMREAAGVAAGTLHSCLYERPREVDDEKRRKIDLVFEVVREADASLLVIDEASMIDEGVWRGICDSGHEKVLLVGDAYQIPPVRDDYSVFAGLPGARLTQVKRTAGGIVSAATHLRETDEIYCQSLDEGGSRYDFELWNSADDAFRRVIGSWMEDRDDHVILTWKNKNRMNLNRTIRRLLGYEDVLPQPGEPVVVCKNVHDQRLMNGDMVLVDEWLNEGPVFAGTDREGQGFAFQSRWLRVRTCFGELRADAERHLLVLMAGGEDGVFDGKEPYVGLDAWKEAVRRARDEALDSQKGPGSIAFVAPITYGYALTCHKAQGSQYRRVTIYVPGDLRSRNFQKMTLLPDGSQVAYSSRWIYTAITRGIEQSSLVVSR